MSFLNTTNVQKVLQLNVKFRHCDRPKRFHLKPAQISAIL